MVKEFIEVPVYVTETEADKQRELTGIEPEWETVNMMVRISSIIAVMPQSEESVDVMLTDGNTYNLNVSFDEMRALLYD